MYCNLSALRQDIAPQASTFARASRPEPIIGGITGGLSEADGLRVSPSYLEIMRKSTEIVRNGMRVAGTHYRERQLWVVCGGATFGAISRRRHSVMIYILSEAVVVLM